MGGDDGPVAEQRRAGHRDGAAVIAGGEARTACGASAQEKVGETMEVGPVQACRVATAPCGVPNLRQEHRPGLSSDGRTRAGTRVDTHEKAGEGATAAESST